MRSLPSWLLAAALTAAPALARAETGVPVPPTPHCVLAPGYDVKGTVPRNAPAVPVLDTGTYKVGSYGTVRVGDVDATPVMDANTQSVWLKPLALPIEDQAATLSFPDAKCNGDGAWIAPQLPIKLGVERAAPTTLGEIDRPRATSVRVTFSNDFRWYRPIARISYKIGGVTRGVRTTGAFGLPSDQDGTFVISVGATMSSGVMNPWLRESELRDSVCASTKSGKVETAVEIDAYIAGIADALPKLTAALEIDCEKAWTNPAPPLPVPGDAGVDDAVSGGSVLEDRRDDEGEGCSSASGGSSTAALGSGVTALLLVLLRSRSPRARRSSAGPEGSCRSHP